MRGAGHDTAGRTLVEAFAAFAAELSVEAMPAEVLRMAKLCLLDTASACLTIGATPGSGAALAVIGRGAGADGPSRVIGRRERTDAERAAFINATTAAASIRTDTHPASASHPGMVVIPAALALAEAERASGAQALAGIVAGYEFMMRLGLALVTPELAAIFRPTGLLGPGPAALAAARTVGAGASETVRAVAIACQTASGLNEWVQAGTNEHIYHAGFAARNAVTALDLARAGAEGAASVLEGRAGLLAGFGALDRAGGITAELGCRFLIGEIIFKPTPACVFVQAPAQAAARLLEAGPLDPDAVEAIEIRTSARAIRFSGCDDAGPFADLTAAQQSIQFGVAAVIAHGGIREEAWTRPDDPAVRELAGRCRLAVDAHAGNENAGGAAQPVHLRATMQDGTVRESRVPDFASMSEAEVARRFLATAGPRLGEARAAAALDAILRLERIADVNEVAALLQPPRTSEEESP